MICPARADRRIRACGHEEGRGTFKLRRQGVRACLQSPRVQRCAAQACRPQHTRWADSGTGYPIDHLVFSTHI
eukprot:3758741-Pleurochrysis_carterae.AAC.1